MQGVLRLLVIGHTVQEKGTCLCLCQGSLQDQCLIVLGNCLLDRGNGTIDFYR